MYGNGVVIGIVVAITHQAHQPILPAPHQALTACFVVVVGTTVRSTAVWLVATTALRAIATPTSGSVW